MNNPILSVQNLHKEYRTKRGWLKAFAEINLQIYAGEVICLLGASGCGKSSLLMTIAGLQAATQGEVYLLGDRLSAPDPKISVIFQDAALLPWLNVKQNIEFGLKLKALKQRSPAELKSHIYEAIASVQLQGFEEAYPNQLSGGMAQRVSLARALARHPQLLLLDEPFSALDAITRVEMQKLLLAAISTHHSTALLVTHDIDEALLLGDRVLLMNKNPGRIHREWKIDAPKPRFQHIHELVDIRLDILQELSVVIDQD